MLAQSAQSTRSPHKTISSLDSGQIFTHEPWQAPHGRGRIASKRAGAYATKAPSTAEGTARKSKPHTEASPTPYKLTYVMKDLDTKKISCWAILVVKRLRGDAMAVQSLAQTPGAGKDL